MRVCAYTHTSNFSVGLTRGSWRRRARRGPAAKTTVPEIGTISRRIQNRAEEGFRVNRGQTPNS